MYKVLIVDDEPIILSGITHLIDWQKEDLLVVGTARDGQTALNLINSLHPDIVITDINMPKLSGIDLLIKAGETVPSAVFIMLTCLEEFALVKEAIRYKAVDYILKTDLEEDTLIESLNRAKRERDNRQSLASVNLKDEVENLSKTETLNNLLSKIYLSQPFDVDQTAFFEKEKMDKDICLLQVIVNPNIDIELNFTPSKLKEQISFANNIIIDIVTNIFPQAIVIEKSKYRFFSFFFFIYNVDKKDFSIKMQQLDTKISSNLQNVIGAESGIIYSNIVDTIHNLEKAKEEITKLKDIYFLKCNSSSYKDIPTIEFSNSSLEAIKNNCIASIAKKNTQDFAYALDMFGQKIKKENFSYSQSIWRSEEIISYAIKETKEAEDILINLKDALSYISNHDMLKLWLFALKKHLTSYWKDETLSKKTLVDRAKAYIDSNIQERLYLSDVADYIGVSSGYLSASFSKTCGLSVVEYINSKKTEEAMRLIAKEDIKIHEICTLLGYENSYYFSKVFKKYAGMSPSEYQELIQQRSKKDEY